jgi:hypothetical protein|tara:strand:- start:4285 stop:4452 length:168 start_codon:yes stop_codon:yes gene_type:complete
MVKKSEQSNYEKREVKRLKDKLDILYVFKEIKTNNLRALELLIKRTENELKTYEK